ncbi:MAG: dTMP kinase [bacterium]
MKKQKGKLIVIDGTDGSGKATQVALLAERLKKEGRTVKTVDFPEYEKNFFGKFIGECLTEEKYNFKGTHPKIVSALFAADRWESKKQISEWLAKGYVVIANRYVSANQIHQGGKVHSQKERREFLTWLDTMEHSVFQIPRPDVVFYLSLPISIVNKLIEKRDSQQSRAYKGKKKDVHESDPKHLEDARKSALKLIKELNNFVQINCAPKKEILSREEIHGMVYAEVKKIIK